MRVGKGNEVVRWESANGAAWKATNTSTRSRGAAGWRLVAAVALMPGILMGLWSPAMMHAANGQQAVCSS